MGKNNNNDIRNTFINNTRDMLEMNFDQSPLYQVIDIDGKEYRVRVTNQRTYTENTPYEQKKIIFEPNTFVEHGSYATIYNPVTKRNDIFVIMFYEASELFPKAYAFKTNKNVKYGDIYLPTFVTSKINMLQNVDENDEMVLPKNYIKAYVKATKETLALTENSRLLIDNLAYEPQMIDKISLITNGVGLLRMNLKQVPLSYDEEKEIENNETEEIIYNENNINSFWNKW